ncbi:MAG: hypothetical protein ACK5LS_06140 [Propioniciclava sp.]
MTDTVRPEPDRAERALRSTLRTHADDIEIISLDPGELRARYEGSAGDAVRRPRRGAVWLAVAAVFGVALLVPVGGTIMRGEETASVTPVGDLEDLALREGAQSVPNAAPTDVRQETFLDVVIDVPADWAYGFTPGPDWCDGYLRPTVPFVDRNPLARPDAPTLCEQPPPAELNQTSLTWRRAQDGDAPSISRDGDWTRASRVVGAAYITVVVPGDEGALANRILDSARVAVTGPRGCASRLEPGRPTSGAVEELGSVNEASVCEYEMDGSPGPNLVGSYALYGEDAQSLFDEMRAAPVAAAEPLPDCEMTGQMLVVRFAGGARQVQMDLSPCGRNLLDDGTAYRTPDRSTCADLLTGPLWTGTVPEHVGQACRPR